MFDNAFVLRSAQREKGFKKTAPRFRPAQPRIGLYAEWHGRYAGNVNSEDRAADPDDPTQPDYDESGVDLSLIRWMLSLTRLSACESRRSSSIASSRRVTSMQNNFEALRSLCAHRVDFILVGDLAAVLNGAPITTYDVDVVG